MYVFIDANRLLSFYQFSNDEIDQLQQLLNAIRSRTITLVLPQQLKDEVLRNRETKIAEALRQLRTQRLNLQFPNMSKDAKVYDDLRSAQEAYARHHRALVEELEEAISSRRLKADQLIAQLFAEGNTYPMEDSIVAKAQLRMSLGNPPGKRGSLGDAINWVTLLTAVPDQEDLYFISEDGDFQSPIDDGQFNQFLLDEWTAEKRSHLHYYTLLTPFFDEKLPGIELRTEQETTVKGLISRLAASGSFAKTHSIVNELEQFSQFTDDQADEIIAAMVQNNQVYLIIDDPDVKRLALRAIADKRNADEFTNGWRLRQLLDLDREAQPSPFEDEESPF